MQSVRFSQLAAMSAVIGCAMGCFIGCTLDRQGAADGWPDASVEAGAGFGGIGGAGGMGASAGSSVGGAPAGFGAGGSDAGSGGSDGGMGGTGGTGGTSPEDCTDGIDNDGDGLVDCEDEDCIALRYACTPSIPDEWTGYFRVRVQANADPLPPAAVCPSGKMPERYMSGLAGLAACGPCSCGPLQNSRCGAAGIACDYENSDCSNAIPRPGLMDFNCHNLPGGTVSCHLTGNNPIELPGDCVPTPHAPDFPNKHPFSEVVDACFLSASTTAGGCGLDEICAEPGTQDYSGAICIMQPDEFAVCPPRWDSSPALRLYKEEDVFDGRSCDPCTCTPDQDATQCVGGSYEVFDKNNCSKCEWWQVCDSETSVDSTTCKNLTKWADGNTISIRAKIRPRSENGKCTVGGGKAVGFVEASKGVTFCCLAL